MALGMYGGLTSQAFELRFINHAGVWKKRVLKRSFSRDVIIEGYLFYGVARLNRYVRPTVRGRDEQVDYRCGLCVEVRLPCR